MAYDWIAIKSIDEGPKYTWKCELHPSTYWHVTEGKQPNAFHRLMHRLILGIKWSRIDD